MPELPDVEGFKSYFDSTSLHKQITGVEVRSERVLRGISKKGLRKLLLKNSFRSSQRRGKYLIVQLKNDNRLIIFHFGMTGSFKYYKKPEEEPGHPRVIINFKNGGSLAYDNQRLFGKVIVVNSIEEFVRDKQLGKDALDMGYAEFREMISSSGTTVKSLLMDQKRIAGIGNIYSDEILFQAQIHPGKKSSSLSDKEIKKLYEKTMSVLQTAVSKNIKSESFPDSWLINKRRKGGVCPVCSGKVKQIRVAGRSAYFCSSCQKK